MTQGEVLVRYFAAARAAAGVDEERVPLPAGATVATLAGLLAERHGSGLERVLAACTFLVDAVAGDRGRSLGGARQVDVLPPFAGG
jgi:sulfur-carrier protein